MPLDLFTYRGRLLRVIDADTLELEIDLGFRTFKRDTFRLAGVNCPERDTPEGASSTAFVGKWMEATPELIVKTIRDKREKYGRWLARVFDSSDRCLNDDLIDAKLAVAYLE